MKHFPLIWSEINLDYLRQNLKVIRSHLNDRRVGILAVVKADAYGHGMKAVASVLAKQGVRFFGVANNDEALELRTICPTQKILVLGSFHHNQVRDFIRYGITPTVSSLEDALFFKDALKKRGAAFPVHVKIDTGMGRLGVWHEDVPEFFKGLKKISAVTIEGVYTHFSSADQKDLVFTQVQLDLFEK